MSSCKWAAAAAAGKKHSSHLTEKAQIRSQVLEEVQPAHVLDVYAGPGGMHDAVWKRADSYVGIDQEWFRDARRVYIGDAHLILRGVDLQPFTIFDVDAYGSPWLAAWTIAKLRRWTPGEVVGFVLTYGSGLKLKLGGIPEIERRLSGLSVVSFAARDILIDRCLSAWLRQVGGRVERRWQATQNGQVGMIYTGCVVRITQPQQPALQAPSSAGAASRRRRAGA